MSCSRVSNQRRAFTLVELLVVLGIIAVLMSILIPTVSRARKQAADAKCLSNMRQIMAMVHLYCNQWGGVLPYTNWGDGPQWNPTPASKGYPGWAYDGRVSGANGFFSDSDIESGSLWLYAGGKRDSFRCPLDEGPWPDTRWYVQMTTYCANGCMGGWNGAARRLTEFKGTDAMFWEVGIMASGGEGWDGANYPTEGITIRHSNRSTVIGFIGGHAELYSLDKFNQELNKGPSTLWCLPGHAKGGWDGNPKSVLWRDN